MELNGWSKDLMVEVAGHGVVSHAGSAVLRLLADRGGLTAALSKALRRRGFSPVHDRGRVLVDTAVMIADGGRVLSDLASLRDQAELFGPVASDRHCGGRWRRSGRTSGPGSPPPGRGSAGRCGR